ncbi:MAG: hypothetical protein LAO06_15260 [Acidobacteriia bacterium]|nr:hypothetical protein [Terriglobia bacterium]
MLIRFSAVAMTLALSSWFFPQSASPADAPSRLAIYYGYPSLINGSRGDVEKAASVFSGYQVVVLGDGIEFTDRRPGRYPEGDPDEHQKAVQIIAATLRRNPKTRFYGYVCLGDIQLPGQKPLSLAPQELEERVRLWKAMGVTGIFLDEAGYDYPVVTRKRQNMAVRLIHKLGLSAFMNAYFLDHLFSTEEALPNANGIGKNPEHALPLLNQHDLFLLESFQVKNGAYEDVSAWRPRLTQALRYRRQFGTRIFATTTTTQQEPLQSVKFSYSWWTAWLYGLDGFSWGEPNFAAASNLLPDRLCRPEDATLDARDEPSVVHSDNTRFWRKAGRFVVIVDSKAHAVRRVPLAGTSESTDVQELLRSPQAQTLTICGGRP